MTGPRSWVLTEFARFHICIQRLRWILGSHAVIQAHGGISVSWIWSSRGTPLSNWTHYWGSFSVSHLLSAHMSLDAVTHELVRTLTPSPAPGPGCRDRAAGLSSVSSPVRPAASGVPRRPRDPSWAAVWTPAQDAAQKSAWLVWSSLLHLSFYVFTSALFMDYNFN